MQVWKIDHFPFYMGDFWFHVSLPGCSEFIIPINFKNPSDAAGEKLTARD